MEHVHRERDLKKAPNSGGGDEKLTFLREGSQMDLEYFRFRDLEEFGFRELE